MSTFFRKRPPYAPRPDSEQKRDLSSQEDDFPVIGPAAENAIEEEEDYPVLEVDADDDHDDVPVITPAAEPINSNQLESTLESIITEEMALAEQRIRQRVSAVLKNHF